MKVKYNDEKEIYALLSAFENATISREDWKHAEHLIVALCYLEDHDLTQATNKMRSGILNLLENGFGVDLTNEMPYHETITVVWMRAVFAFSLMKRTLPLHERANLLTLKFDKDLPLHFYTRELLFSEEARARFVEPDLFELGSFDRELRSKIKEMW